MVDIQLDAPHLVGCKLVYDSSSQNITVKYFVGQSPMTGNNL